MSIDDQSNDRNNNVTDGLSPTEKPTMLQLMASVFAAAFGVQNSKNRERDFSQNSFTPYIIAGVVFTILFVAAVYLVVSLVLQNA